MQLLPLSELRNVFFLLHFAQMESIVKLWFVQVMITCECRNFEL